MRILDDGTVHLDKPADAEAACARLVAMQAPTLLLYRAAADGTIFLAAIHHPATSVSRQILKPHDRPTIIVISDDPDASEALGPHAWLCAKRVRSWATAVMVHAAAGDPEHYRMPSWPRWSWGDSF